VTGPWAHPATRRQAARLNAAFVSGYVASATAVAGLAYLLGRVVPGGPGVSRWVMVAVCGYLAACDLRLGPLSTPMINRQTRPQWRLRFGLTRATLFWGLDIGTTVSTIKATSLYWLSLVLLLGQPQPPLQVAVVAFAAGYLISHMAAVYSVRPGRSVSPLVRVLNMQATAVRLTSAAAILGLGVLIAADVIGR
jgi:hypothetical protein